MEDLYAETSPEASLGAQRQSKSNRVDVTAHG
jgi:hypothetical protein